jgi:homoserine dehydrogenase
VPHLAFQPDAMAAVPWLTIEDTITSYYFRMRVADQPGVLADIARILADGGISIDALFQREPSEGENQTDIIMLTHEAVERDVNAAIVRIEALETVLAPVIRLRQEELS